MPDFIVLSYDSKKQDPQLHLVGAGKVTAQIISPQNLNPALQIERKIAEIMGIGAQIANDTDPGSFYYDLLAYAQREDLPQSQQALLAAIMGSLPATKASGLSFLTSIDLASLRHFYIFASAQSPDRKPIQLPGKLRIADKYKARFYSGPITRLLGLPDAFGFHSQCYVMDARMLVHAWRHRRREE